MGGQFLGRLAQYTGASCSERMADGERAPIRIQPVPRKIAEVGVNTRVVLPVNRIRDCLYVREDLSGECFMNFKQGDVVQR